MSKKITVDGKEYVVEELSPKARQTLELLQFTKSRLQEMKNTQALLQRAKNSYVASLKEEVISNKAGFFINDESEGLI